MKKLFLILLLAFSLVATAAEPKKRYCEIVGKGYPTKSEVKIEQTNGDPEASIVMNCKTMIDAVNILAQKGWTLEQSYAIVETQGMKRDAYFHYILSKPEEQPNTTAN